MAKQNPSRKMQQLLQAAQEERLRQVREMLKPTPVRLHHEPVWLKKIMRARVKQIRGYTVTDNGVWGFCKHAGVDPHFLDHWGTTEKGKVFVSEPYINAEMMQSAIEFAKVFGLQLCISAVSEWNPPSTIRLMFREKEAAS